MSELKNAKILLGISGGIAAYKCAELVRLLKKGGADVQVVMTPAAEAFITPLTLQALSGTAVRTSLLDPNAEAAMGHIELARWADLIIIAPASADILARLAHGFANDLLSTLCLAAKAPIAVAPAMNQAMWHNPITLANMEKIASYSHFLVWGPAAGAQACGDSGLGRMLEPADIYANTLNFFSHLKQIQVLAGKKIVITAGPTREAIDPVRFLSNQSSGKMGYALAQAAVKLGASVILISGPTALQAPTNLDLIHVTSAIEMLEASLSAATDADLFIGAAAVADFRPAQPATQKIKKGDAKTLQIDLVKNPDIIANIAKLTPKPWVVGFAAETQDVLSYAQAKLTAKNLDMIIANDVSDESIGFNSDNNAVTLIGKNMHDAVTLPATHKTLLAEQIMVLIAHHAWAIATVNAP